MRFRIKRSKRPGGGELTMREDFALALGMDIATGAMIQNAADLAAVFGTVDAARAKWLAHREWLMNAIAAGRPNSAPWAFFVFEQNRSIESMSGRWGRE